MFVVMYLQRTTSARQMFRYPNVDYTHTILDTYVSRASSDEQWAQPCPPWVSDQRRCLDLLFTIH